MTATPETPAIVARVMALRAAAGLKLTFDVNAEHASLGLPAGAPFTCFAKDAEQKARWLAQGKRRGWVLLPNQ